MATRRWCGQPLERLARRFIKTHGAKGSEVSAWPHEKGRHERRTNRPPRQNHTTRTDQTDRRAGQATPIRTRMYRDKTDGKAVPRVFCDETGREITARAVGPGEAGHPLPQMLRVLYGRFTRKIRGTLAKSVNAKNCPQSTIQAFSSWSKNCQNVGIFSCM